MPIGDFKPLNLGNYPINVTGNFDGTATTNSFANVLGNTVYNIPANITTYTGTTYPTINWASSSFLSNSSSSSYNVSCPHCNQVSAWNNNVCVHCGKTMYNMNFMNFSSAVPQTHHSPEPAAPKEYKAIPDPVGELKEESHAGDGSRWEDI